MEYGYAAVRSGHTVRFIHADNFFRAMAQARVDNSVDRAFRSFLTPDLLIVDDLGLHIRAFRPGLNTSTQGIDTGGEFFQRRESRVSGIITANTYRMYCGAGYETHTRGHLPNNLHFN